MYPAKGTIKSFSHSTRKGGGGGGGGWGLGREFLLEVLFENMWLKVEGFKIQI